MSAPPFVPERIVSGGQTGADRAALDVARERGIARGGWVPRGRRAEDGAIPAHYEGLRETASAAWEERTAANVRDSDATLVVTFGAPRGGTKLTCELAERFARPLLVLDRDACGEHEAARRVRAWLDAVRPRVLNVAGPRASQEPRIAAAVTALLRDVLQTREGGES